MLTPAAITISTRTLRQPEPVGPEQPKDPVGVAMARGVHQRRRLALGTT